jgi:hypothetical protein
VHEPLTQADATHAVVEPHWPLALQTCVLFPWQRVAPGVQTPVQAPLTHAWFVQLLGEPHAPLDEQVWIAAAPEHCVDPGTQMPMHDPVTQAELTQAVLFPHVPLEEQVSTLLFTHRVALGAHTPVHEPFTHA